MCALSLIHISTGTELKTERNGSGNTVLSGAAVAVSKYSGTTALTVNLNGGTLEGLYALYEAELNATESEVTDLTLSVTCLLYTSS